MKGKFTKLLLPVVALAMVMGTSGLKEIAYSLYADEVATEYVPYASGSDYYIKNQLKTTWSNNICLPNFTFLIHGYGSSENAWSNNMQYVPGRVDDDCLTGGKGKFCYNADSIIAKIEEKTDANVYVAECDEENSSKYHIYYYERNGSSYRTYDENGKMKGRQIRNIQRVDSEGKHSVVVFHSNDPKQSNANEFAAFERIANRLCYDFKVRHGYTPKVNLIGHSRGGLIAQEYANNYPHNVYSINTIASPFFGSETGRFLQRLNDYPIVGPAVIEAFKGFNLDFVGRPGFNDFQNNDMSNARKNAWNDVYFDSNINATAYGGVLTLPYIKSFLGTITRIPVVDIVVGGLLSGLGVALDRINSENRTSYVTPNFTPLIDYETFERDCYPINTASAKAYLEAAITPIIDLIVLAIVGGVSLLDLIIPGLGLASNTYLLIQKQRAVSDLANTLAKSIYSYKGQVCVLKDDFLVGLNSQMCPGYYGYKRLVKVFDADYLSYNNSFYATEPMPLVGHNIETMNKQITNSIIERGKFATKSDVQDYVVEHGLYTFRNRKGSVNYYFNQDDLEINNGHGHYWGEFHGCVNATDVPQQYWNTIEVTCVDNHSTADYFDCAAWTWYDDLIMITIYVHEEDFDPEGFVTINYEYRSDQQISYITLSSIPKSYYYLNESIDYTGLKVRAVYTNGTSEYLKECEYSISSYDGYYTDAVGQHAIIITVCQEFQEAGTVIRVNKTAGYVITVREPRMTSLTLFTEECQTEFYAGDTFNSDGLMVYASYENNDFHEVHDFYVDTNSINMSQPGVYPVYVSYTENNITITESYEIRVDAVVLDHIELDGGFQTVFEIGEMFNYDGLEVIAFYNNGFSAWMDDGFVVTHPDLDMTVAGFYTIYVSYTDNGVTKETSYEVEVVYTGPNLEYITFEGDYQTEFTVGEDFNCEGLQVVAHWDDGSVTYPCIDSTVVSYLDANMNVAGTYPILVWYTFNGVTASATYTITVEAIPAVLRSITLSGDYQTLFVWGSAFNTNGLIVTAHYFLGGSQVVTNYEVVMPSSYMFQTGTHLVTISYTEGDITVYASYQIKVSNKYIGHQLLSSIALSGDYQTIFRRGDEFNYDGLLVTANYADGSVAKILNFEVDSSAVNMKAAGTYEVIVSYTEGKVTVQATYKVLVIRGGIVIPKDRDDMIIIERP